VFSSKKKPSRIVAIDWDARTLRIVHAIIGKRGVKIDKILSAAIPPDVDQGNPEEMGAHIRAVLREEGISTRSAVVDIPRDQAVLNTLKLPCAAPEELPGMVQIQIAKGLPFPVGDAAIDFAVPPDAGAEALSDVLVAAVRREVLEQYESTFEAAGLRLERVGLRPFANKVAICELFGEELPERVLFVDVRPVLTEIDVIRSGQLTRAGQLAFARAASVQIPQRFEGPRRLSIVRDDDSSFDVDAPLADEPMLTAEAVVNALVLEVMRSLEAYRAGDAAAQMDAVVIGGDTGVEERLAEELEHRLNVPTRLYNPAPSFGWDEEEGLPASAYAATLGLVIGHAADDKLQFDFLHPKRMVSPTQQRLRKAPLVAAVIASFVVAGVVVAAQVTADDRRILAQLDRQITALEKNLDDNKKFLKLVNEIEGFDEDQQVWVDVLYDLVQALPSNQELVLSEVIMRQKENEIALKIKGKERDTGTKVVDALNGYRREGETEPLFKAKIHGDRKPDEGEDYPFHQDVRIAVLKSRSLKRGNKG
jgi:type IV pilus assembly protein PilM